MKCHHHPTIGWLVFLSTPQDTHLPWLKTNDVHKHTWRRESMLLSQRLHSGTIIAHTICLQSSQCVLISSLLPYLSLSLASSPSPLLSKQPRVACQGSKLLALSGLQTGHFVFYSCPDGNGYHLPTTKGHNTPVQCWKRPPEKKTLKLIWQGKITGDLSQQTQNQQPHRRCIAKLPISTVSSGILEYNIRAGLEKHIVIRKGRL